MRIPRSISGSTAMGLAIAATFVILWFPVLTGQRVLLAGDVLYQLPPWSGALGAHTPSNTRASDPVVQDLVWQEVFARDVANGDLPLWNPTVEGGVPFLANDQAAVISPLNWLALLFQPAVGLSIAMLLKLLIAGFGMFFFLRRLDAAGIAAAAGGVAYATSSFMVDWLAWPLASVADYMPWIFGLVEAYLRGRRPWALPGLALVVCLQFLAGHAETSFHVGLAAGLYVVIRWIATGARLRTALGLIASVAVGTLLAGIQLVPFIDLLRQASLISSRTSLGMGYAHLNLPELSSWIFPNALGNPAIDGLDGRQPNFNESTGYAGVAALVLAPVGIWWSWLRERSVSIALVAVGVLFAALVYGQLVSISARLPGFNVTNNQRALVVMCFCVAALAGLGLDGLIKQRIFSFPIPELVLFLGQTGLLAVAAMIAVVILRGARVDHYLPHFHHSYIGFWLLLGAISLGTAAALVLYALLSTRRGAAIAGLCAMVLLEGAYYTGSFYPRVPLSEVPPSSPAITWLQSHAQGTRIAALDTTLLPEAAVLYGLDDARGYEILTDPRQRAYWSAADPGFSDSQVVLMFGQPASSWLAAAGVGYVMMPPNRSIPGTTAAYQDQSVIIAEVPSPRPFAYLASSTATAANRGAAVASLSADPLGPVVVEGCCAASGSGTVNVTRRTANEVTLDVTADTTATLVVQQSYDAGWTATIDGSPISIQPADVLFQSVQVPEGHHTVRLTYAPHSVVTGAETSAAGLVGLVLLTAVGLFWRAKKKAGGPSPPAR